MVGAFEPKAASKRLIDQGSSELTIKITSYFHFLTDRVLRLTNVDISFKVYT